MGLRASDTGMDKRARETVSYLMPYWHVHVNVTENSKALFSYTKCRFFR